MTTLSDDEEIRLASISALDLERDDWRERFRPGTHGCHEAMHMASVLSDTVSARLVEHPAIVLRPEWHALACKAAQALFDLYLAIGAEHMDAEP